MADVLCRLVQKQNNETFEIALRREGLGEDDWWGESNQDIL